MSTPEQEYSSTIAYLIFPEEYEKYCSNATQTVEEVMSYSLWLERYKCVCPEDIRMLVERMTNSYRLGGFDFN